MFYFDWFLFLVWNLSLFWNWSWFYCFAFLWNLKSILLNHDNSLSLIILKQCCINHSLSRLRFFFTTTTLIIWLRTWCAFFSLMSILMSLILDSLILFIEHTDLDFKRKCLSFVLNMHTVGGVFIWGRFVVLQFFLYFLRYIELFVCRRLIVQIWIDDKWLVFWITITAVVWWVFLHSRHGWR